MGEFDYINRTYGLSLRQGTRCVYTGHRDGKPRYGTVAEADGQYIRVRFDDAHGIAAGPFHPTWEMTYPEQAV